MNKKPNILMLILDGIRADSLSCYGYSKNTTPNIDRIANKSVVYENAFSAGGWTLPAMASIFTGAYPSKHGVHNENRHLSSKNLTLAQSLHEYGYCSAKFSDVHYMGNSSGMSRGFDFDFDYKRTKLQKIWKRTKNVIFNHNDKGGFERTEDFKKWVKSGLESPFFAYIHYEESHYPHRTPSPYKNHFLPNGINYKQASKLDLGPTEHYAGLSDLKEKEFEIRRSLYDQSLLYVDNLVGDLYSFMEKEGLLEDTIIIITSDHGENFGENGHLAHWYVLYDTIIKVPLIIHNPSIFGTGRISSLVQTLDIYSTFGEILEFDDLHMRYNQGIPLPPVSTYPEREYVIAERFKEMYSIQKQFPELNLKSLEQYEKDRKTVIRTHTHKYIHSELGNHEFFDLINDKSENKNIFGKDILEEKNLQNMLLNWRETFQPSKEKGRDIKMDDKIRKDLIKMGYLTDE